MIKGCIFRKINICVAVGVHFDVTKSPKVTLLGCNCIEIRRFSVISFTLHFWWCLNAS